ncbi:MAG: S41 family peptidase [Treponema sp.]|jgi:carboxyl-terminal processing protease|nr:S41 family peptidase [Treponema sp.]
MNEQNNAPLSSANPRKFRLSALWVASTLAFCLIFAITIAPRAHAQGRTETPASSAQFTAIFRTAFEIIQRYYIDEVDAQALFEGAMRGLFNSLDDPNTAFLSEAEMDSLRDTTQGVFGGVGLFISPKTGDPRPDGRPNFLEVAAPIEDTPGWRAGINSGDFIVTIDGYPTDVMSSDEAVSRLRGQPNTDVELLIRRGDRVEFPVTLTRAVIQVPTVRYAMIGDIGYLRLLNFTPHTANVAREAIQYFQENNYRGIILDLRNNAGGRLDAAVAVSNLFAEGQVVVTTRSRIERENRAFYARGRSIVTPDTPVIVLINRGSASAAEIVAGALKDWGLAYLVGERTFGKGSVQQVYPLGRVGFRMTTARYFTPSDASIDAIGIPPDREVSFPDYFVNVDVQELSALVSSGRISDFTRDHPNATPAVVNAFVASLTSDFNLDDALIRRLIRNDQNRRAGGLVLDLEYDVQLREAVRILSEENFHALMENTRTLRNLQEEAAMEMEEDAYLPS